MSRLNNVSVSSDYPILTDEIREKSWLAAHTEGCLRQLVKQVGVGQKGVDVAIPTFNLLEGGDRTKQLVEGATHDDTVIVDSKPVRVSSKVFMMATAITKKAKYSSSEDLVDVHQKQHAQQAAFKGETELYNATVPVLTREEANERLTLGTVVDARARIKATRFKGDGNLRLVVTTYQGVDLFNDFTDNPNYGVRGDLGNKFLDSYYVKTILRDVDVFENDIMIPEMGAAKHSGVMFYKNALGMYLPADYELTEDYKDRLRGWELVSSIDIGGGVIDDNLAIRITTDNRFAA